MRGTCALVLAANPPAAPWDLGSCPQPAATVTTTQVTMLPRWPRPLLRAQPAATVTTTQVPPAHPIMAAPPSATATRPAGTATPTPAIPEHSLLWRFGSGLLGLGRSGAG